jgi:hypothetical protein
MLIASLPSRLRAEHNIRRCDLDYPRILCAHRNTGYLGPSGSLIQENGTQLNVQ